MKKITVQIISMLVLTVAFAAVSANAQSNRSYMAHIPFDFSVGEVNFKAGDYAIRLTNSIGSYAPLTISSPNGRNSKIVMSLFYDSATENGMSKLVFNRYGDQYVLAELATPYWNSRFSKPKMKDQLMAENKPLQTTLVLTKK